MSSVLYLCMEIGVKVYSLSQCIFMSVYIRQSRHLSLQAVTETTLKKIQLFPNVEFCIRKVIA
jgi:hypothetical protein